ncbi:MAG: S8 family serine peptidase, partial [Bacteroidales bacterium]
MKTYLLLFCCLCSVGLAHAQNQASDFTGNKSDQARNPRNDLMNFVPNEVLVKFKDAVPMAVGARLKAAGISSIDKVLAAHGITSLEKLFPAEQKPLKARMMKSPQGKDMKIPALDKIYRVSVPQAATNATASTNIFQLIEELKALPEVEYAEPNYIYSIDNMQPVGPVLTAEDVAKLQTPKQKSTASAVIPNDPLYGQQWYIPAVKADSVWQQTTGDTTQVIAILDTGVDWNHPDLKNKIWTNPNPATSWNMEGVMDDIRGWDFINNDNNPMDDNSHGTHVAGIAAAETNNGIGVAGVCPKAKIMPVKVLAGKGGGDLATVVKGINYAATRGATIINMSFGSYANSSTLVDVLLNAYNNNILLVAAAGNDSHSIYDINPATDIPYTMYPAAISFVFGVQSDGSYSNFDPDGPIFSDLGGLNYELKAPGTALSTVPNGNYRSMSGTSMATPIVSGSLALYRSIFPDKSLEELWSDFIHSSDGIIDLNKVFFGTSKIPQLDLVSYTIDDQNEGNDKDNKPDAGETINLTLKIRNTGSPANVVYAKIRTSSDVIKDITILKDSVRFGSIGIYRSMLNDTVPFKIKINNNCNNNGNVSLDVMMYNNINTSVSIQNIKFKIYNGQELSGILLRDTTFTPDKNWVISNSLRISAGVTLTILPGTSVEVLAGVDNRGKVIAIGTPEKRVNMKGVIGGDAVYKYANLDFKGGQLGQAYNYMSMRYSLEYCDITNLSGLNAFKMKYSRISNSTNHYAGSYMCDSIYRCLIENFQFENFSANIYETVLDKLIYLSTQITTSKHCLYTKQTNLYKFVYPTKPQYDTYRPSYLFTINNNPQLANREVNPMNISNNTFLSKDIASYFVRTSGTSDIINLPNQYWGTNNIDKIKNKYIDFTTNAGSPYMDIEPKLTAPSDSCPGHVWKVLVNGKDAQDEVVDPVGVGKHRFDVYFNRAMNKDSIPQVTFGGIYPYKSNKINENGSWSEDGKIYTVYKTIKLTTGDGINQIRVAGAKQAGDWGWVIPIEDSRFSFIISAANSASAEFMATQGLGKVKLEWNNSDLADGLGYNMYRMEHINDSTLTEAVMINPTLI